MGMTVEDFMEYSIEKNWQTVHIYDVDLGEEVFIGIVDDMPDKYLYGELCTFDIIDKNSPILTLNVEANEDY